MLNRYLQSSDGFFSKVFGCGVALGLVSANLYKKKHCTSRPSKLPYSNTTSRTSNASITIRSMSIQPFKNKMDYLGPFENYTAAARQLNPSLFTNTNRTPSNISIPFKRFANYEKLLSTEKGQFYIAYNPDLPPYNSNPQSKNSPLFNKSLPTSPFLIWTTRNYWYSFHRCWTISNN